LYVFDGHSPCVKGNNLFVKAIKAALVLSNELMFKAAISIAWHRHGQRASFRYKRFRRSAIATIERWFFSDIAFFIASNFFGNFQPLRNVPTNFLIFVFQSPPSDLPPFQEDSESHIKKIENHC